MWNVNNKMGNHRIIADIDKPYKAVLVDIEWRRRDPYAERSGIIVENLTTGKISEKVYLKAATQKSAQIIFNAPDAGRYAIYYMPYELTGNVYSPSTVYITSEKTCSLSEWWENEAELTAVEPLCIESRSEFDIFNEIELPATTDEIDCFLDKYKGDQAFLLFPEDRRFAVRMNDVPPIRWIEKQPSATFTANAQPNEYYVFQLAVWAQEDLDCITVNYPNDLPFKVTCFNIEGIDHSGHYFTKNISIKRSKIQALWFGLDIPENLYGSFMFEVSVCANGQKTSVSVTLNVEGEKIVNKGDNELWRLSRLRWLNSTIGLDNNAATGYPDIEIKDNSIKCLGRIVEFNKFGLPSSAKCYFNENNSSVDYRENNSHSVLAEGIAIKALADGKDATFTVVKPLNIVQNGTGRADIYSEFKSDGILWVNNSVMEYDGFIETFLTAKFEYDLELDFSLVAKITEEASRYMMGLGKEGGYSIDEWDYKWALNRPNNMLWLGNHNSGIQIKPKHLKDVWEIYSYEKQGLPEEWSNNGSGGWTLRRENGVMVSNIYTGKRLVKKGEEITWRFSIIITPLKTINTDEHWDSRYNQGQGYSVETIENAAKQGAKIINVHHANVANPFINYPFQKASELKKCADAAHKAGVKYKLYYTVRELSIYAQEIWAFRSLGDEIYRNGPGFVTADHFESVEKRENNASAPSNTGGAWLCEHLIDNYVPAWHSPIEDSLEYDMSIATTGLSRLHNYYLEGLAFLMKEIDMDGIYLDGVGYDRQIMKRVRKAMDYVKEGCLIDFHSGNNFHPNYGLCNVLNQYLELMPGINHLWIGEGFEYETVSADYYLTEISGIPLGLMSEMLHGGGNPYLGMNYGMANRLGWWASIPAPVMWNFWDEFGLKGSIMYGWWQNDCPVKTGNDYVKATLYKKADKVLISLGSYSENEIETITLEIDFNKLGLNQAATAYTPEIKGLQSYAKVDLSESLQIAKRKGLLIVVQA